MIGKIILFYVLLQILMGAIMAVFPRDEGMRVNIGLASFTSKPKSAGDYFFNGLVILLAGGALYMEHINDRIQKKHWAVRIGTRLAVLSIALVLAFILAIVVSLING
ncbi:hypothetical protein ACFSL6_02505 [Paenibacillus thailandensis]|uniref:Uncharacterized protein n=1 Tax=Paenibacillus thailandensis TaxID=393250 RepID=A0ABW5QUU0_9BACL